MAEKFTFVEITIPNPNILMPYIHLILDLIRMYNLMQENVLKSIQQG